MTPYSDDVLKLNPELVGMKVETASKYHNARAEVRGLSFQSGHEASVVGGLIIAEEQKKIFALRLQVKFPLQGGNSWTADAVYLDEELVPHVVDAKGFRTKEYRIKAKLFREKYGKEIEEL